jgi:hypothetical protein
MVVSSSFCSAAEGPCDIPSSGRVEASVSGSPAVAGTGRSRPGADEPDRDAVRRRVRHPNQRPVQRAVRQMNAERNLPLFATARGMEPCGPPRSPNQCKTFRLRDSARKLAAMIGGPRFARLYSSSLLAAC